MMITTTDREFLRLVAEIRVKTGWSIEDAQRAAETIIRDVHQERR